MANFINDEVKIDFPVSRAIRILMEECEQFDREDNYPAYEAHANVLVYVVCKEACFLGDITKNQWEKMERRYEL